MTDPRDKESLIEQAAGAHRSRDRSGKISSHPAWHDLDEAGRQQLFSVTEQLRTMEAALDDDGLSTTGRAVMAHILGLPVRA